MATPTIVISTTDGFDVYPNEGLIKNMKTGRGPNKTGQFIGTPDRRGYLRVGIGGRMVFNYRYIFETYHGVKLDTKQVINHLNMIHNDNHIDNLQMCEKNQLNMQWRGKQQNNTSGYKGIYWDKVKKKWMANLIYNRHSNFAG